jgi:hypothetical protein
MRRKGLDDTGARGHNGRCQGLSLVFASSFAMPLTGIVTIVLRIFSLLWLVNAIVQFVSLAHVAAPFETRHTSIWIYAVPIAYLLCAFFVFVLSHPIARLVTPPPNAEMNLATLTRYDLYCFAFTFLGLHFFLSSFGESLNRLHYYVITAQLTTHEGIEKHAASFYPLTRPLLTLVAGLATLLLAPRLARKLTTLQQKQEPA